MNRPEPTLPEFLADKQRLAPNDRFGFACHPEVPCFNRCCADVNIVLTPLDVLRLSRRMGLQTRLFLERHTANPITKDLHLPIAMLKMKSDDPDRHCPFLGDEGCTVYDVRPWACRMYPLGMALPPARAGEEPVPVYFVFEDDHCEGRCQPDATLWTADEWRRDQGLDEQDALEQGFRELVGHPWFIGGRKLDPKRMHMFYTAAYDLDSFRSFVFESSFLERFAIEPDVVDEMRGDDLALLTFAFRWLRFALFGEPTIEIRPEHADPRRSA